MPGPLPSAALTREAAGAAGKELNSTTEGSSLALDRGRTNTKT